MLAALYDIVAEQGSTFTLTFVWKDVDGDEVDLTTYDMRINIASAYGEVQTKFGNWDAGTTTQSGDILIGPSDLVTPDGSDGKVEITISASVLALWDYTDYVYTVELTEDAGVVVVRLVQGKFSTLQEIPNA